MPVKVSVVVPVYNPGEFIEPCVRTLLAQTLPPQEVELLFVDDGSTDDTPARLDRLAEQHPHLRVIHIPNSGWPGKPRNVGTEAARGEYVLFMDQDDALEPGSLERMHAAAAAVSADVVLGKVVSDFRGVNQEVYRVSRDSCDVWTAPLMDSLTPHKMVRTQFLRETGIRYPEGPRRLEDQLYMTKVYFAAQRACIVADYVCYRYQRRPDGKNAGSTPIEPVGYFANLREVLDVVDRHTAPGPERDRFYRRFLKVEMMQRLAGRKLRRRDPEQLPRVHAEIRRLMQERFPLSVDAGLGALLRVRAGVVRRGTLDDVVQLAAAHDEVRVRSKLLAARATTEGPELEVEVRLRLAGRDLVLERSGDRLLLPRSVAGPMTTEEERDVTDQLGLVRADLVARHRTLADQWFLDRPLTLAVGAGDGAGPGPGVGAGVRPRWRGRVLLDPRTAALGHPLGEGRWDLYARVHAFGVDRNHRLGAVRAPAVAPELLYAGGPGGAFRTYLTDADNLTLHVGMSEAAVRQACHQAAVRADGRGRLRVSGLPRWRDGAATLRLRRPDGRSVTLTAEVGPGGDWLAVTPARRSLRPGVYQVVLPVPGSSHQVVLRDVVTVTAWGQVGVRVAGAAPSAGERVTRGLAAVARRLRAAARR